MFPEIPVFGIKFLFYFKDFDEDIVKILVLQKYWVGSNYKWLNKHNIFLRQTENIKWNLDFHSGMHDCPKWCGGKRYSTSKTRGLKKRF